MVAVAPTEREIFLSFCNLVNGIRQHLIAALVTMSGVHVYKFLLLALCSCALAASEGVVGYATSQGAINLSDAQGNLVDLAPGAWGPNWAWTGIEGTSVNDKGITKAQLGGKLGGTGVPFRLDLHAGRSAARTVKVSVGLKADQDTALTLVILGLTPGQRFQGEGRCIVTDGGVDKPRAVPFGQVALGSSVTRLRFMDAKGATLEIAFAKPTQIVADGSARIVLAAEKIAGGTMSEVAFTMILPEDLSWYPTPAEIPFPSDWKTWFVWKPTAALTAGPKVAGTGISMANWSTEPAGTHGRVVRKDDQLLVDGKATQFWGINNCYAACSPEKTLADKRAELYPKMGINAVRLHKFADGHGWNGFQSADSFAEFDAAGLDRMDYYIAQLKAKGIYVKLSSNFGVNPGPADLAAIPWIADYGHVTKGGERVPTGNGAIYVASELQDLQFRQMTNLLKHKNPYTGLTYAEEPAIMVIEQFNEDSALFYGLLGHLKKSAILRKRMGERFATWLAKRYGDEAGLTKAWGVGWKDAFAGEGFTGESFADRFIVPVGNPWFYDPDQLAGSQAPKKARLLDTMTFLGELQDDFYKRYAEVMRAAGYQGEILSSNWIAGRGYSHYINLFSDSQLGIIDRHNYFGGGGSMLTRAGSGILSMGACQVAGRPFMLSEWIHTFPTEWGVEGPAIIGAYGMGLQGWDVSFMFENGDNGGFLPQLGGEWEVTAPQILGVFPAVARQVRRGDVKPAQVDATRNVHVPSLSAGKLSFDDQAKASGDVKESDSTTIPARSLAVARNVVAFTDTYQETPTFDLKPYAKDGALVSSTGELRWIEGADAHIVINTAATQAVVGFAGGRNFELADVAIAFKTRFAAVYVCAADPGANIKNAERLIVTTLARARNTDMKFVGDRLLNKGKDPIVIEPVAVELSLKRTGSPTVYVCDHDGNRTPTTIPVNNGKVTLDSAKTQAIWYEIVYK